MFRPATVAGVLSERRGLQKVSLEMDGGSEGLGYVLTDLVGEVASGDRVICNTTAVELSLGTGGWHFVHWNLSRESLERPGPEHIMKLRYTSLQSDVGTSELDFPEAADAGLDGVPVVACSVHSQVPLVALAFAATAPGRRLAYVMTDGAALPIAMSDIVAELTRRDLICGTVTSGHAFGGDLEAVSLPSALGLARHVLSADAVVVGMGPGVVGTGTEMGTTAVEVASILDLSAKRGGRPILCLRASDGDPRPRHAGRSHHMDAVLGLTHTNPLVAAMGDLTAGLAGVEEVTVAGISDVGALLEEAGMRVTTMGRDHSQDPLFFRSAAAAGVLAAELLSQ